MSRNKRIKKSILILLQYNNNTYHILLRNALHRLLIILFDNNQNNCYLVKLKRNVDQNLLGFLSTPAKLACYGRICVLKCCIIYGPLTINST